MHQELLQMLVEKNPTPITRPCHRVICSNGSLGGYSAPGGAIKKKKLLESEGLFF